MSDMIDNRRVKAVPLLVPMQSSNIQLHYLSASNVIHTIPLSHMPPVDMHLTSGPIWALCVLMLACYGMLNPKKYDHLAAEYL